MSPALLKSIAEIATEARFDPSLAAAVDSDGHLCLILEGSGETATAEGEGTGEVLGQGDCFADLALLSPLFGAPVRVRALTAMHVLSIPAERLSQVLSAAGAEGPIFRAAFDQLAIARFLRSVANPFRALDEEALSRLSGRVRRHPVSAGQTIFRQGDPGDSCYLVAKGEVEVLSSAAKDAERPLAALGPGAIFGEVALLTGEPRNATVRARVDSELLALRREDLIEFLAGDREARRSFLDMVEWRSRPRKAPDVVAQGITTQSGEFVFVLKRPAQRTYYRLSEVGWFVWQRLDGRRQLRDLALECMEAFQTFAPAAIQDLLHGLAAAGFIEGLDLRLTGREEGARTSLLGHIGRRARRISQLELSVRGVDPAFSAAYRHLFWRFFTRPALVLSAVIALAGFAALLASAGNASNSVERVGHFILLLLIPGQFIAVLVHEGAHAFAVKRYGRELPRVGIGWYWFGPIAFVDTSDMWLAPRWPRIVTSLAGPCGDLLTGGVFGIIAWLDFGPVVTAASWQLALSCFAVFLLNFNPLLEYDGYYALSDLLDRPNLRRESLRWFGDLVRGPALARLRGHLAEALYSLSSCAFVVVMAAVTLVVYRLFIEGLMAGFLPQELASVLAYLAAGLVAASAAATLLGEMFEGDPPA